MSKNRRRLVNSLLGVLVVLPQIGFAQDSVPADWSELQRVCAESGLHSKDSEKIIGWCQKNGYSLEQTFSMLSPACEAGRSGLPTEPITQKIEEGLAKEVPPQVISSAAGQREGYLRSAREIAQSTQPKLCLDEVIIPSAFAMESGLSRDVIESVIDAGREKRAKEIRAALEAGESLHLAGFDAEEIALILRDCLSRNLRRVEFKRVVRYASQQRERGMEAHRIRRALWGNGVQQSQQQHQHKHSEQHGGDQGRGPGPGGPSHGGHGHP